MSDLTKETTDAAKRELARDFGIWLKSGGSDTLANCRTRTAKCYETERALATLVARAVGRYGDNVARGALINYASGLSDYVEPDMLEHECVHALRSL